MHLFNLYNLFYIVHSFASTIPIARHLSLSYTFWLRSGSVDCRYFVRCVRYVAAVIFCHRYLLFIFCCIVALRCIFCHLLSFTFVTFVARFYIHLPAFIFTSLFCRFCQFWLVLSIELLILFVVAIFYIVVHIICHISFTVTLSNLHSLRSSCVAFCQPFTFIFCPRYHQFHVLFTVLQFTVLLLYSFAVLSFVLSFAKSFSSVQFFYIYISIFCSIIYHLSSQFYI